MAKSKIIINQEETIEFVPFLVGEELEVVSFSSRNLNGMRGRFVGFDEKEHVVLELINGTKTAFKIENIQRVVYNDI